MLQSMNDNQSQECRNRGDGDLGQGRGQDLRATSPRLSAGSIRLSLPSPPLLCRTPTPGRFSVFCLSLPAHVFDREWMVAFGCGRLVVPTSCATGSDWVLDDPWHFPHRVSLCPGLGVHSLWGSPGRSSFLSAQQLLPRCIAS